MLPQRESTWVTCRPAARNWRGGGGEVDFFGGGSEKPTSPPPPKKACIFCLSVRKGFPFFIRLFWVFLYIYIFLKVPPSPPLHPPAIRACLHVWYWYSTHSISLLWPLDITQGYTCERPPPPFKKRYPSEWSSTVGGLTIGLCLWTDHLTTFILDHIHPDLLFLSETLRSACVHAFPASYPVRPGQPQQVHGDWQRGLHRYVTSSKAHVGKYFSIVSLWGIKNLTLHVLWLFGSVIYSPGIVFRGGPTWPWLKVMGHRASETPQSPLPRMKIYL